MISTANKRINSPRFIGSFTLLISDPLDSKKAANVNNELIEDLARNTTENDIPTLIELLKSPLVLSEIASKYNIPPRLLGRKINIKLGGGDRYDKIAQGILKVSHVGGDPKENLSLLNDLSKVYLETALKQRQQRLTDGLDFLNKQAPELENKTALLQTELSIFRKKNAFIEPSSAGNTLKELEKKYIVEIMQLDSEKVRLEKLLFEMQKGNLDILGFTQGIDQSRNNTKESISIGISDQALLSEILGVKNDLAKARSIYQPNSRMVKSLEARIEQLEPIFFENQIKTIKTALKLNQSRMNKSIEQRNELKESFLKQPDLIKEYENLQQRLKIAQNNLSGLISARETFQLEMAQQTFPWRIIKKPKVNLKPIYPSIPRELLIGLAFGTLFGVVASFIKERLDHVYHDPKEVEDGLNVPNLTNIPHIESLNIKNNEDIEGSNLVNIIKDFNKLNKNKNDRYQRFFYQEALRSLYTSIKFSGVDKKIKIIAITSSIPAEGKSLINILFAKILGDMGKKVLLIDSDLRKPQIHKRLGLDNIMGFSNLITDNNLKIQDVTRNTELSNNLSVITAGIRPPDPTLLLSSSRMQEIVNILREEDYEFVIFDTPPVIGISDASLISDLVDGLILIVSLNKVDKNLPKESFKLLSKTKSTKLGFISNSVREIKLNGFLNYNYSAYSYKYGYGYGSSYADISSYVENDNDNDNDNDNENENNFNKKSFISTYKKIKIKVKSFIKKIFNNSQN